MPDRENIKRHRGLLTLLYAALTLIAVLHLFSSVPAINLAWEDYSLAKRLELMNQVANDLFQAVRNYGFERGRVNVVLNDAGPVSAMEKNRQFIHKKRAQGDQALAQAMSKLKEVRLAGTDAKAESIKSHKQEVTRLRALAEKDMITAKVDRDPQLPKAWFPSMTRLIKSIEALLVLISQDISDADGSFARLLSLQHKALALRNTSGPEMSILSGTMLSGKPLKPELAAKISKLQVESGLHFKDLRRLSATLQDTGIPLALQNLEEVYFQKYLPKRELIYPAALKGGPYPLTQPQFLGTGVKALESIAAVMDQVVLASNGYAQKRRAEATQQLVLQGLTTAGTLGLIVVLLVLINSRVIRPVTAITRVMRSLAAGDLEVAVPAADRPDEVGDMARAVEVFKGNSIQLRRDMEARRKAEEALRENQAALLRAQRVARVGSWELDIHTGRVSWSEELWRIAGLHPGSVAPTQDSLWELAVDEDREGVRAAMEEAIATGEPYQLSYRISAGKETERTINEIVEVEKDSSGQSQRLVGTVQDITEMRRMEAQMLQTQKLESLGVVAGGIAHDFNNILAGIMGYSELSLLDGDIKPKLRSNLDKILGLSQRAADISRQMLAYTGKGLSEMRPLDMSDAVRQMSSLLGASLPKNARVHLDLLPGAPLVLADPAQISQAILNLVTNAAEALPESGGDITVRTGVSHYTESDLQASFFYEGQPSGDYLCLEVEDSGWGIKQDDLDKVFDPFFTTKFTGRGLGLAVVLGIVRNHAGVVFVESDPGLSTRFSLLFPVDSRQAAEKEQPQRETGQADVVGAKVLIIDDEEHVREVAASALTRVGYEVLLAASGREGLDLFRKHGPELDLIILDMTMPDMSGDEVYKAIHSEDPDIRIIIASGYSKESLTHRFQGMPTLPFLQKPWTREEFLSVVRSTLKSH